MIFYETKASNQELGVQTRVWLPYKHRFSEIAQQAPDSTISATIDNKPRLLLARPVQMMIEFNASLKRREQLGQDCAVFALACMTGNCYNDTAFNQPGGSRVVVMSYSQETGEPEIMPGEVGYTTGAVRGTPDPLAKAPHLFVRATADQEKPLYFSKLGAKESELVVLSDFEGVAALYPVLSSGQVLSMREEPFLAEPRTDI